MASSNAFAKNEVDEVKLAELYTTAGVYYAAAIIAVVFAQFSVLGFLQGKNKSLFNWSLRAWPFVALVAVYVVIVIAGCYFVGSFLKFSMLLDQVIVASSNLTLKKLVKDEGSAARTDLLLRKIVIKHSRAFLAAYVFVSVVALLAVLYIA